VLQVIVKLQILRNELLKAIVLQANMINLDITVNHILWVIPFDKARTLILRDDDLGGVERRRFK